MATPRYKLVDGEEPCSYHLVSRCVRRAWLCGWDDYTERDYSYRRDLQQGRQPQLRERPQGDVLRADAARPHQGQGVDRHLDARAERGPASAVDVEVAAEVEQGALADAAAVAFGAHQAVGVVAGAVGLTGLGAADEHGGGGSGGGRRAQDPKLILWHYICSGDHAPTKNQ